jgi:hypothetical protein
MRDLLRRAIITGMSLAAGSALGQMHKVAKPEQVVRAVGVYEWTGDLTKPAASRLVPVTVFIDGKLEDAGVYIARPVPFALLSGNVYELQDAGVDKGMLDLAYARHMQAVDATGNTAYDDGWFGYGSFKPLAVAKRPVKLRSSTTLPVLTSSVPDSSHPRLGTKAQGDASSGTGDQTKASTKADTDSTSANDPDRPTMKRRSSGDTSADTTTSSGSGATSTDAAKSANTPADDPDRPTMKRRSSDSTDSTSGTADSTTATPSTTAGNNPPADDPDRPTLKRHSAEDAKKARNNANDLASVSGTGSLNDDPNRPNLHHGKPTSAMTENDLPKLIGLPADLHQMVAVSDAANRDPHEFALAFDDDADRVAVLAKLQAMARTQLRTYESAAAATKLVVAKKASTTRSSKRVASAPVPEVLLNEELKGYTLSYGGAATYVYSAHTAGAGTTLRYVTIVAQADGLGELKPAIQSVTDAAHLDETPRMRFVDVVDVEASNRASLLFELRGQNSRQFGLYRVIAAHSEQTFVTGTTQ